MKLLYDEENDVLDIFFNNSEQNPSKAGYELRDGVVLYVTAAMSPAQLTFVNFRRLTQLPVVHFDGLEKQPEKTRQELLPLISLTLLAVFLRIDPSTNYGHIVSPPLLEVCQ